MLTTVKAILVNACKTYESAFPNMRKLVEGFGSFAETIYAVAQLDRSENQICGRNLADYKLDTRWLPLVLPRGVYASAERYALDFMSRPKGDLKVMTPSEFMDFQANVAFAMKSKVAFGSDLEQASEALTLGGVGVRAAWNSRVAFEADRAPVPMEVQLNREFAYNITVEDWYKEAVSEMFRSFGK